MPDLTRHLAQPEILTARERLERAYALYDALSVSASHAAIEAACAEITAAKAWVAAVVLAAREGAA